MLTRRVPLSSEIYLLGKYFDYPLRPTNAMFGMGIPTTARIMADYGWEKVRQLAGRKPLISL